VFLGNGNGEMAITLGGEMDTVEKGLGGLAEQICQLAWWWRNW
jgi:hypothetical protein